MYPHYNMGYPDPLMPFRTPDIDRSISLTPPHPRPHQQAFTLEDRWRPVQLRWLPQHLRLRGKTVPPHRVPIAWRFEGGLAKSNGLSLDGNPLGGSLL